MATAVDCLRYEELRDAQKFQFCTRLNPIKLIAKVGDDDKLAANLPGRQSLTFSSLSWKTRQQSSVFF
jgi:hypothetical protein